jgi:hypothetical protein
MKKSDLKLLQANMERALQPPPKPKPDLSDELSSFFDDGKELPGERTTPSTGRPAAREQSGRPQLDDTAVHLSPLAPSTPGEASRPQELSAVQPSTQPQAVDARPSTRPKRDGHRSKSAAVHKKDRHRGDLARYDNRIDREIHKRIKLFLINENLEQREFAELSAVHFMDYVDGHKNQKADGQPSLDDRDTMIMYKTSPAIINLYIRYNPENKWKPADDRVGRLYNDVDLRIIENGIIITQFNARFKRIHSFEYYRAEIDECKATPLDSSTLDVMLASNRRRWNKATEEMGKGSE